MSVDTAANLAALTGELRNVVAHLNGRRFPDLGWVIETVDGVAADLSEIADILKDPA